MNVRSAAMALVTLSAGCTLRSPADFAPASVAPAAPVHAGTASSIVLDANPSGPVVSADAYGASLDTWYDFVVPWVDPSLLQSGVHLVRFPGGSESDVYHWESGGSLCNKNLGYITPQSTFDNLMTQVAAPVGLDIAVTLNYGSNRTCSGGGDPTEAAAWVAYAKARGYNVPFWTVGNEVYGSWEYDLHPRKHDPHTYAAAVRTGYYPDVKAANAQAKLGVVADFAQPGAGKWNAVVFREAAPFDFVEIHYYPEYNHDNDSFLLGSAIDTFAADLATLRKQMNGAGLPKNLPVYLGEYNNDAGQEGKQSVSIVNALYLGQMLGTALSGGVSMTTWWVAYGSCDQRGDFSKSLYGWQNFGTEALFSDGLPNEYESCANTPPIAHGTPFPTARVMALLAHYVPGGSTAAPATVSHSLGSTVRAYGFARNGGYVLAAFNNTLQSISITVSVRNSGKSAFDAALAVYGKAQYDLSKKNQWVGPVTQRLGRVGNPVPLQLPPYSVSVLSLR